MLSETMTSSGKFIEKCLLEHYKLQKMRSVRMSSDTARENASVVDSSVTEWKLETGNFDGPESPIYKEDDGYPLKTEREGHDCGENSSLHKNGRLYNTRYFIIKSLNHDNLQLSVDKGIWATQVMNEPILEEAFHNSAKVILIFSVNMSGFFQGYAQMMSSVGWRRDNIWSQGCGRGNPWGRSFKIKWLRLNDLPFQKTLHLKNPLNDYKPVKISRDCQELPEDVGEALCELIDGESSSDGMLNRDDAPLRRPYVDPPCSLGDGEYNPLLQMPWFKMPTPYPNFLYQLDAEANQYHMAHYGSGNVPPPIDAWGLTAESPHASTLTEDDFLEMTYEEYLEAHSRSVRQLNGPVSAVRSSRTTKESSRSKRLEDDSNSSLGSEQSQSRKKSRN